MSRSGEFDAAAFLAKWSEQQKAEAAQQRPATNYFPRVDKDAPNHWGRTKYQGMVTIQPDEDLTATQGTITEDHPAFRGEDTGRAAPRIVDAEGGRYITDGHHRLAAARQQGRAVRARLYSSE